MKNTKEFISEVPFLISKWDYEANRQLGYDPTKIRIGSEKNAWWKCDKGHSYQMSVYHRAHSPLECLVCSGKRLVVGVNDLATLYPQLLTEWDYERNEKRPEEYLRASNEKVWWVCAKCGHKWQAAICARTKGRGCFKCGRIVAGRNTQIVKAKKYGSLSETHPGLLKEWDYAKNINYTPDTVSKGSDTRIWWKCRKGHSWEATISSRVAGNKCPFCSIEAHTSFREQAVLFYLEKLTKAESRKIVDGKEIDIFLPDINIGIEYNGRYWHHGKDQSDDAKVKFFAQRGIRIFSVLEGKENIVRGDLIEFKYKHRFFASLDWAIKTVIELIGLPNIEIDTEKDQLLIEANYLSIEKENSIVKKAPHLLNEWDYEANNGLSPELFSTGSDKKVHWICAKGHQWSATVSSRVAGNGCPYCANRYVLKGYNDLQSVLPDIAKEWHPEKNGDFTPDQVVFGSHKKAWWLCKNGHEWYADIHSRTGREKRGCPICNRRKTGKK